MLYHKQNILNIKAHQTQQNHSYMQGIHNIVHQIYNHVHTMSFYGSPLWLLVLVYVILMHS